MERRIDEQFFGKIPCDCWRMISLGSAGGLGYQKVCNHENCYPRQMPGDYTKPWGTVALLEELRRQGYTVTLPTSGGVVLEREPPDETFEISLEGPEFIRGEGDDLPHALLHAVHTLLDERNRP
jgi:hypothetical protein